jgi:hypothetical protein
MERTVMSTPLIPAVIAMVLLAGSALAQESAAQSAKQLQAPDKPLIYDDSHHVIVIATSASSARWCPKRWNHECLR